MKNNTKSLQKLLGSPMTSKPNSPLASNGFVNRSGAQVTAHEGFFKPPMERPMTSKLDENMFQLTELNKSQNLYEISTTEGCCIR